MANLRQPVMRAVMRAGYLAMRVWWFVARPTTRGVKCVLKRDGQVLLVRHTYGPDRWELPGGGVKRREEPSAAARREVHEELSIDVEEWRYLGELFARVDGKRDRVWCFSCEIGDGAIEPDHVEIAEAHWFAHDRLPPDRARHVARILEMQA